MAWTAMVQTPFPCTTRKGSAHSLDGALLSPEPQARSAKCRNEGARLVTTGLLSPRVGGISAVDESRLW